MDMYTLITRDGTETKMPYTLPNRREHVTSHFTRNELDTGHEENAVFFKPTLDVIEETRMRLKTPITGSSGYRSRIKQAILYQEYLDECKRQGKAPKSGVVAKPGNSPHETGAAVDLYIPDGKQPEEFAKLLQKVSIDLGFPIARVGWKDYLGRGFVHVDLVFLLFTPYTSIANPFPNLWLPGVSW
ncbi:MAG TPA: hypothetical protein DDW65_21575 [Firmicutes bacterium]|jgi:hypothetical protein|nr:hypothetical protein [Bacillota bacterium]